MGFTGHNLECLGGWWLFTINNCKVLPSNMKCLLVYDPLNYMSLPIPSGKHTTNYGKSPLLICKSGSCSIAMLNDSRVNPSSYSYKETYLRMGHNNVGNTPKVFWETYGKMYRKKEHWKQVCKKKYGEHRENMWKRFTKIQWYVDVNSEILIQITISNIQTAMNIDDFPIPNTSGAIYPPLRSIPWPCQLAQGTFMDS